MALSAGDRLGPYEILEPLGAGGMGEVYRAADTKLGRDVAIKVFPSEVTGDSERLARFQREAHLLASLNHSHIAAIYGLEEADGKPFLVLELVEGEDLAERLKRGPIPVGEALEIARQVAEALEEAHEKRIIHRDLKPANVKVTPDGKVKVLDFGLAKAWAGDAAPGSSSDLSQSPTLAHSGTQAGVILGTAAYMSPEQARGKPVDRRADIWAFGAVLFEMLSGKRLFGGETIVEVLAAVIKDPPRFDRLPMATPGEIRRLLARCLERDPKLRLRDIGEARIALAAAAEGGNDATVASGVSAAPPGSTGRSRVRWAIVACVGALVPIALFAGLRWGSRAAPAAVGAPLSVEIVPTPADAFAQRPTLRAFTFMPDGRALIYASSSGRETRRLYRRDRDSQVAVPIAGTEGGAAPFVSPDGAWIGFLADGKVKRTPAGGGSAQTVHDLRSRAAPDALAVGWNGEVGNAGESTYGAVWLPDDTIVYGRIAGGLWQVPSGGGSPRALTTVREGTGEFAHRLPEALPGGRALLFTVTRHPLSRSAGIEALDLGTGERTPILDDATDARFVPGGFLLFARRGALYSIRFDPKALRATGEPVRLVDDLMHAIGGSNPGNASGAAQFDVSPGGTLAFLSGGVEPLATYPLSWVTPDGRVEPLALEPRSYFAPRISPDGTRIASFGSRGGLGDPWQLLVADTGQMVATPLATNGAWPVWTADGSRIFVGGLPVGRQKVDSIVSSIPVDGASAPEPLVRGSHPKWPSSASADGRWLAYVESHPTSSNDIWVVGIEPKQPPRVVVSSPANESHPAFSPDGRWLAYASDEGGSIEVYVRPFPGPGLAERISRDGGTAPVWARGGRALFYFAPPEGTRLVAREIARTVVETAGDRVRIGASRVFARGHFGAPSPVGGFDLAPDGRILVVDRSPVPSSAEPAASAVVSIPSLQVIVNADLTGRRRGPGSE